MFSVQVDVSGTADSTMYCIALCLVYKLMYLEQLTQQPGTKNLSLRGIRNDFFFWNGELRLELKTWKIRILLKDVLIFIFGFIFLA